MSHSREAEIAEWIMDGGADEFRDDSERIRAITTKFPNTTLRQLERALDIADELYTAQCKEDEFRGWLERQK